MLDGDAPEALAHFLAGITADRSFTPAWVNLGVLHPRNGYRQFAEAASRFAIDQDACAGFYRNRVKAHRMHNPCYR